MAHDRRKSYNIPEEINMPKVWVAGSVNMDIVATAARYPKIGETVAGRDVFFFPGGKGANQAVSAAKLGARTALIGKVGSELVRPRAEKFSCGAKRGSAISPRHRRRPHRHGRDHSGRRQQRHSGHPRRQCPAVGSRRHRACAGERRCPGKPVRSPRSYRQKILFPRPIRRRYDDPQSGAGHRLRSRPACAHRHPHSQRDRARNDRRHPD